MMNKSLMLAKTGVALSAALLLSACSTLGAIGGAVDAINPFDKTRIRSPLGIKAAKTKRVWAAA